MERREFFTVVGGLALLLNCENVNEQAPLEKKVVSESTPAVAVLRERKEEHEYVDLSPVYQKRKAKFENVLLEASDAPYDLSQNYGLGTEQYKLQEQLRLGCEGVSAAAFRSMLRADDSYDDFEDSYLCLQQSLEILGDHSFSEILKEQVVHTINISIERNVSIPEQFKEYIPDKYTIQMRNEPKQL